MDIKPFLHQHYLLHDEYENQEAQCDKCNEKIDGWAFTCESCKFWLHELCALQQLPQSISHPLHSQHLLSLCCDYDYFVCDKCFTLARSWTYECGDCHFRLDLICASSSDANDQTSMEESQRSNQSSRKIKHFSHGHDLTPFYYRKGGKDHCSCVCCEKLLLGSSYGCFSHIYCKKREVFFHESCLINMPTKISQHHFHPSHPLLLYPAYYYSVPRCNACNGRLVHESTYGCEDCKLYLHVYCSTLQPSLKSELHDHGLTYFRIKGYDGDLQCKICNKEICDDGSNEGVFYACVQCHFYLHLRCSIPFKTKHEYHRHELTFTNSVVEDYSIEYYCDICEEERNPQHHVYYCNKCSFVAHIECALKNKFVDVKLDGTKLMEQKEINGNNLEIDRFDHKHSLTFYEVIEQNESMLCEACCLKISGQVYACKRCKYYLHKTCAQLSQKLLHPLHPRHALQLIPTRINFEYELTCQKCRNRFVGFVYRCYLCNFALDVKCAADLSMPANENQRIKEMERQSKLCLFNQNHKLSFFNYVSNSGIYMSFCDCCKRKLAGPSYECIGCGYTLHECCLGFPWEMQLKFHPQHPVHLVYNLHKPCRVCGYPLYDNISYSCGQCDLHLHPVCAKYSAKKQATKLEVHNHGLYYYGENIPYSFYIFCKECTGRISDTPFYFCPECSDCKLHFNCARIPHSVEEITPATLEAPSNDLSGQIQAESKASMEESGEE
ncbi:hypothetical protein DITRI_Ditri06bG0141700 [Diplodiscus trichospermus]